MGKMQGPTNKIIVIHHGYFGVFWVRQLKHTNSKKMVQHEFETRYTSYHVLVLHTLIVPSISFCIHEIDDPEFDQL